MKSKIFTFLSWNSKPSTFTNLRKHDIRVGDVKSVGQRFYLAACFKQKSLDSCMQYLRNNGLAVPSFYS